MKEIAWQGRDLIQLELDYESDLFIKKQDMPTNVLKSEIQEWMLANIGPEADNIIVMSDNKPWMQSRGNNGFRSFTQHKVLFRHKADAILFKLTWV